VRRPVPVWSDEAAPHKLARATLAPGQSEIRPGSAADLARLRGLAVEMNWGPGELTALYQAVRSACAASATSGETVPRTVANALAEMPSMQGAPRSALVDAAYLAAAVADGAQVQRAAPLDVRPSRQPFPLAQAAFDAGAYQQAVDVFYRGQPTVGEEGPWAGYAPPPSPATPERTAQAREILVRALGSGQAAEAAISAWQKGVAEEDARQLPLFMSQVGAVPARFDGSGAPAAEFREAVAAAARRAEGSAIGAGGEEFFEQLSDELLREMDEGLADNAGELAARVEREGAGLGPAAGQLQQLAAQQGWEGEELAVLIQEALRGAAPGIVAALPEFRGMDNAQVAAALGAGRDVAREVDVAAATMVEGGVR
jgi:hypothetical protein